MGNGLRTGGEGFYQQHKENHKEFVSSIYSKGTNLELVEDIDPLDGSIGGDTEKSKPKEFIIKKF